MPGSRGKNFRGGDLSEGFGLELMRPFAFIAPVPRTEDVGIDAVATLFRREGERLLAEDSFFVQAKAASKEGVVFSGSELDWLRKLPLPYFLLTVNRKETKVDLWSIHGATGHPNFRTVDKIEMCFGGSSSTCSGSDCLQASLRAPVLTWTALDAGKEEFHELAYGVLKEWIKLEGENMKLRELGVTRSMAWQTNEKPRLTDPYQLLHLPGDFEHILRSAKPYVTRLMALNVTVHSAETLRTGIQMVRDYMRENGVDPDPGDVFENLNKFRPANQRDRKS